jgi:RHH-type rel operon transcriptional repressor/antitoxin RelB
MSQTTTMTIHLPVEANNRLEALAQVTHTPLDDLAARAIEEYLDLQEYQIKAIQEAVEEADSPNAKFLDQDEVVERMKKLGNR